MERKHYFILWFLVTKYGKNNTTNVNFLGADTLLFQVAWILFELDWVMQWWKLKMLLMCYYS
ncbi:MAG: hypothetical protein SPLM_04420 [Spiroplasma phoeniceum]